MKEEGGRGRGLRSMVGWVVCLLVSDGLVVELMDGWVGLGWWEGGCVEGWAIRCVRSKVC